MNATTKQLVVLKLVVVVVVVAVVVVVLVLVLVVILPTDTIQALSRLPSATTIVKGDVLTSTTPANTNYCYYSCSYCCDYCCYSLFTTTATINYSCYY